MYSVVEISGHQYRIRPGDLIDVELLSADEGKDITLDKVLFVGGETPILGLPVVAGAKVKARVIRHDEDRKIIVSKRRPGAWRRKNGHRQNFTALLITEIHDGSGQSAMIDAESKNAKKYLK